MAAKTGPDFVALQVRDLDRSRLFYTDQLGLNPAPASPPGAIVFDTSPIPFAIREPMVDLDTASRLGWAVALWLAADDAQAVYDRLAESGTTITQAPTRGAFGLQFSFTDPAGYPITIHQAG
ncbi:MAG: VOC family protein [Acidimicrobiales bacterium]